MLDIVEPKARPCSARIFFEYQSKKWRKSGDFATAGFSDFPTIFSPSDRDSDGNIMWDAPSDEGYDDSSIGLIDSYLQWHPLDFDDVEELKELATFQDGRDAAEYVWIKFWKLRDKFRKTEGFEWAIRGVRLVCEEDGQVEKYFPRKNDDGAEKDDDIGEVVFALKDIKNGCRALE